MDQKQHQLISSCSELQDELVGCGQQLQQINALLDILWRAACHDATHGGYPEVVQLARRQVSQVSDRVVSVAGKLKATDSPTAVNAVSADLTAEGTSKAKQQSSDVRLQSVERPINADLDKAS